MSKVWEYLVGVLSIWKRKKRFEWRERSFVILVCLNEHVSMVLLVCIIFLILLAHVCFGLFSIHLYSLYIYWLTEWEKGLRNIITITWYQSNIAWLPLNTSRHHLFANCSIFLPLFCFLPSLLLFLFFFSASSLFLSMSIPMNAKPSSTINIKHVVPFVLELHQINYDIWRELFEIHCIGYGTDDRLKPRITATSDKDKEKAIAKFVAAKDNWLRVDSIVKSWLYGTLSISLLHMIFKK